MNWLAAMPKWKRRPMLFVIGLLIGYVLNEVFGTWPTFAFVLGLWVGVELCAYALRKALRS